MGLVWSQLARDLAERLDADLPARVTESLAVDPRQFRASLTEQSLAFRDPAAGYKPDLDALDRTAEHLIKRATRAATVSGAVSGMAGMAGVPPEIAWRLVQLLRLAQRLAIVYGTDPTRDKGRLLIQRAMAASFEVDLPAQGGLGMRVSDLPAVLRDTTPTVHQGATWLAQAAVRQTAKAVLRPLGRAVPGLASAPAAWRSRQTMRTQAARMLGVIRRGSADPRWTVEKVTDAIEVG